ncbi:hypothetical protein IT418_01085 [bacterium]|nr:hypothetical protein [bacterium]
MSLHAPFLVKQYLSSDVESGSYSRIFWYFPLDKAKTSQGGIGLFFEVLSGGEIGDDVYEQITKRFWESFSDNFYTDGFESALKKSVKMFIQLLQNFGVQEGMDVNIVLLNVVEAEKGYTLKLIQFGDSDIFVIRDKKYADMGKMVPDNETLYDLKFLEVELDKGDVLLLGNKTLLRNALETDMFALTSVDALLRSLEEFKENLFGSKKLFLIAATGIEVPDSKKVVTQIATIVETVKEKTRLGFDYVKDFVAQTVEKIKKQRAVVTQESAIPETTVVDVLESATETDKILDPLEELTENTTKSNKSSTATVATEELGLQGDSFIEPPPVLSSDAVVSDMTDHSQEEKPEEDIHIVNPVELLPGKEIAVDDFVIAEEITPAMVVEKSEYQEIVEEAKEAVETKEDTRTKSFLPTPILPVNGKNYVDELRARHSPLGRLSRHPVTKRAQVFLRTSAQTMYQKILSLLGRQSSIAEQKLFLSRPTSLEKKKIQPGMVIILIVVILSIFLFVRGKVRQNEEEKTLLASYQQQVAIFSTFFEQSIESIDAEDTENQLELCVPEASKVYEKESIVLPKIKSEQTISEVKTLTSQVQAKVAECQAKYDRIYGIVRVKDVELVTDFKVSLGNDSDISAITFRGSSIVVADKGRKSVYQINVETKSVVKLEDPLGLVVDPVTVGTGEGTLFVCDKVNGVLYFSNKASGNQQGFNRIVGAEPTVIGECSYVDGYAKNVYVVPTTANVVYKIAAKAGGGFEQPTQYIKDLLGVQSITIDNFIYTIASVDGKGEIKRFYGGKLDNFTVPQRENLGQLTSSYTNPSGERNLYVYDKTKNAVLSIEKPNSKHPGRGIVEKIYQFDQSDDRFKDVKSIAVDLNVRNQEVYMYVLSGATIWRFRL